MIVKFGCDPMGGGHTTGDEFTLAGAARDGETTRIVLVKGRGRRGRAPFDLEATVYEYAQDILGYGAREVVGDRYSANWVVESFRRHGITYRPSERSKSELYLELLPLFAAGRIELPPDPELLKQLKLLERRRGAQGKDTIDHPQGAHDDRAAAVALAVQGLPAWTGGSLWGPAGPPQPVDPRAAEAAREIALEGRVNRFQAQAGMPISEWWERR